MAVINVCNQQKSLLWQYNILNIPNILNITKPSLKQPLPNGERSSQLHRVQPNMMAWPSSSKKQQSGRGCGRMQAQTVSAHSMGCNQGREGQINRCWYSSRQRYQGSQTQRQCSLLCTHCSKDAVLLDK